MVAGLRAATGGPGGSGGARAAIDPPHLPLPPLRDRQQRPDAAHDAAAAMHTAVCSTTAFRTVLWRRRRACALARGCTSPWAAEGGAPSACCLPSGLALLARSTFEATNTNTRFRQQASLIQRAATRTSRILAPAAAGPWGQLPGGERIGWRFRDLERRYNASRWLPGAGTVRGPLFKRRLSRPNQGAPRPQRGVRATAKGRNGAVAPADALGRRLQGR